MNTDIPYGYCHCGCGEITRVPKNNHARHGYNKGIPIRFVAGHASRGANNPKWNGGKRTRPDGYIYLWIPDHPRANRNYVMEHIIIVEKVLGYFLPERVEIHHINERRGDNKHDNLVVCQNVLYHRLLHKRMRARKVCGYATWKKCVFCKTWDDPINLFINSQGTAYHVKCERESQRLRRINKEAL